MRAPNSTRRRLLAGLPLILASRLAPAQLRQPAEGHVARFALGIASGQPQADRLVLWTRLTGPDLPDAVPVRWQLAHDEGFASIAAQGEFIAERGWAHSVHAEPAGLAPGRWYWYRFTALGQQSPAGRTRTAPAADAPATLNAALASCQRWDHGHWAAWRDVAEQAQGDRLDLVLFVGDYVYEYASPRDASGLPRRHDGPQLRTLDHYRARYAQYKSDPALQAAHAAAPWLLVWDDHEVENDYAADRGQTLAGADLLRLRAAAYQAWWEHQPVPMATRPAGPDMRIHHRLDWGRLARIHALDDRQYRSHQACLPAGRVGGSATIGSAGCAELRDPRRSLLGEAQERWLADGWSLDRPWNLLAQQTLMAQALRAPARAAAAAAASDAGSAADDRRVWTDGWDGYPLARQRLLDVVARRKVPGVVALGGDVHAHYVAGLKTDFDDPRAPVVASEFCGTSISSHGAPQAAVDTLVAHNPHLLWGRSDQRGWVQLQLQAGQLQVALRTVRDAMDPASPVDTAARFVVAAGQPGPQRQ